MESSSTTSTDRAFAAAACSMQQLSRRMTKSRSCHDSSIKMTRPTIDHLARSESERGTVLYLAYGSNLCKETFRGKRGIKPLSQVNVQVPSLRMTFDLPGIPYAEPCFANSGSRDAQKDRPYNPSETTTYNEKTPLLRTVEEKEPYHKDDWHKGLVGVVYEVTAEDYAHIIATEGGGAAYHDVLVDCHPFATADPKVPVPQNPTLPAFKAHTLFAPAAPPGKAPEHGGRFQREDPAYAQPSARYLKLITDGAMELDLPYEYQDYLHRIRSYTITSGKQRVGQYVFMTVWLPVISFIFVMGGMFQDENGKLPAWMVELSGAIFKGVWASYDSFFEPMFGDGERSIPDGGDDVAGSDADAQKAGKKITSMLHPEVREVDVEKAEAMQDHSYQSREVINVSQGEETPMNSSPFGKNTGTEVDCIKDSLDARIGVGVGGPVQPPQQLVENGDEDEDDLYGLSPKGKASVDAARSSKKLATQGALERRPQDLTNGRASTSAPQVSTTEHLDASAVQVRHKNSAAARKSQNTMAKGAQTQITQSVKSAEPRTSIVPKSTARTQQRTKPVSRPQPAPTAPAGTSSLALLHARRHGVTPAQATQTPLHATNSRATATAMARKASPKRAPLRELKNTQTPARKRKEAATTTQQPTEGKVSLRAAMLAETPKPGQEQITAEPKRKSAAATTNNKSKAAKKTPATHKTAPSTQARSARSARSDAPISAYDMPDSPSPRAKQVAQPKPPAVSKKPGLNKAAAGKAEKAKEMEVEPEPPRRDMRRKRARLPESDEVSEPIEVRKQPARQAKEVKAAPPAQAIKMPELREVEEVEVDHAAALANAEGPSEKGGSRQQETIEDFEDAVVDYSDEEAPAAVVKKPDHTTADGKAQDVDHRKEVNVKVEAAAKLRKPNNASRKTVAKQGSSQENAIMLSDRREASSSPPPPSPAVTTTAPTTLAAAKKSATQRPQAPQTPAIFHSSPPTHRQEVTHQRPTNTGATGRTTIIGFDRSGPRNQGTRSAKKPATGSARTDRTSLPPNKAALLSEAGSSRAAIDPKQKNGPSSAAKSTGSSHLDHVAAPHNVAPDVSEALAGFRKKPARKPTATDDTRKAAPRASRTTKSTLQQPNDYADEGFTNIDDAVGDVPEAQEVMPAKALKKSATERTASQRIMPPPASKAVEASTMSAKAQNSRMAAGEQAVLAEKEVRKEVKNSTVKRPREEDIATQPVPKKSKGSNHNALHTRPLPADSTEHEQSKVSFPEEAPAARPEPAKRPARKVSRHASQGVDIHGSPIPKNMVVPEHATTLETYSQHTDLSSDQPLQAVVTKAHRTTIRSSAQDVADFEQILAMPSRQPATLHSNEKRKPASPREDSQAITAIALGIVNPKQLVIRGEGAGPATNPFSSSEELRKVPAEHSSTLFGEELRTRAKSTTKKDQVVAVAAQQEDDDEDATLVEPEPTVTKAKGGGARKRRLIVDDPDETLVEPEPAPKKHKGTAAPSHESAKPVAATNDNHDTPDMPAISFWRDALKLHQSNLFDELVGVSHRLVKHLVTHEEAMCDALHDYHKHGLNLIEQQEKQQALDYQQAVKKLEREKKARQQDLQRHSEQLRSTKEVMREGKTERAKITEALYEEEEKLKQMLTQLGG
ncbi:hypothetical protein LTR17_006286 [Elasticomyces elasticus]|nr:hypothetical protein LTR17_006286 [Elasticomyces elasticus]